MKCPVCDNELRTVTNRTVNVDYCDNCRGVWFDLQEMEQLSDAVKEFNIVEPRLSNLKLVETFEKKLHCPKCGMEMDKVMMNGKLPMFDYCPNSCGYWFDETEIKEYIQNNINSAKKYVAEDVLEILKNTK